MGFCYLSKLRGPIIRLMDKILHDPKALNYGNYGIFLIMGSAGVCPSTVLSTWARRDGFKGLPIVSIVV